VAAVAAAAVVGGVDMDGTVPVVEVVGVTLGGLKGS
jgi:hypothetical protein